MPFQIFSGTFDNFAGAGGSLDLFQSDAYFAKTERNLKVALGKPAQFSDYLLAPVAGARRNV